MSVLFDQMKKFGVFGVIFSSIMLKVIFSNPNECYDNEKIAEAVQNKDYTNAENLITDEKTYELYKARMSDVIRHASMLEII